MNIESVLEVHGYQVGRRGTNDVYIKCPFCFDDPSYHLGINVASGRWGCWRDADHKGRSLVGLFRKLGISERFVDGLRIEKLEKERVVEEIDFQPLDASKEKEKFVVYLRQRGISVDAAMAYGLRCAVGGRFKDRIMLPVVESGQIKAWTGRLIREGMPRYLSVSKEEVEESIAYCLFNESSPKGDEGRVFIIVEGPFDAINIELKTGFRSMALMGKRATDKQIIKLLKKLRSVDNVFVWLDKDALSGQVRLVEILRSGGIKARNLLIRDMKDPGSLTDGRRLERAIDELQNCG